MQTVITEFINRGNDFLFDVFTSEKYLEELTGINTAFHVPDDDEVGGFVRNLLKYYNAHGNNNNIIFSVFSCW